MDLGTLPIVIPRRERVAKNGLNYSLMSTNVSLDTLSVYITLRSVSSRCSSYFGARTRQLDGDTETTSARAAGWCLWLVLEEAFVTPAGLTTRVN